MDDPLPGARPPKAPKPPHPAPDLAWWYFPAVGALLASFAVGYGCSDWIWNHLGEPAGPAVMLLGIIALALAIGMLFGLVINRRSRPGTPPTAKDRLVLAAGLLGVLVLATAGFAAAHVAAGLLEDARDPAIVLPTLLIAAAIGVGGRPAHRYATRPRPGRDRPRRVRRQ